MTSQDRKTGSWTWGVRGLDDLIGPVSPGRLYVIGARPSNGKTAFLMNLVNRITSAVLAGRAQVDQQPYRMLAWFTERSRRVALRSLAALHCELPEDPVLREDWVKLPEGSRDSVLDHSAVLHDWWPAFVCLDRMNPTLEELKADLEEVGRRYDSTGNEPEILVMDYLQMVQPARNQTVWDACREVMQWFRRLAGEGKTVIVTSQLKRRGDGVVDKYRPPHLEDFLGGGLIEATAEVALGLFRPLKKMTNQEMREVREGRATLEKWWEPGVMAIKCLKHTYLGPAADGIVRARIGGNRVIRPYDVEEPPIGAGDAWEPEDQEVPF